jgi:hypothetical protein
VETLSVETSSAEDTILLPFLINHKERKDENQQNEFHRSKRSKPRWLVAPASDPARSKPFVPFVCFC